MAVAIDEKKQMHGRMRDEGLGMVAEPGRTAMARSQIGGLAGWLLGRLRGWKRTPARLAVLERIALAPRQSLALVEAEGRRFLIATSAEGTPAFYALDPGPRPSSRSEEIPPKTARKIARAGVGRLP